MNRLKIIYTNEKDILKERCNPKMDEAFEKIAEQFGYEFIGSGYDFEGKKRDLEFEKKEK